MKIAVNRSYGGFRLNKEQENMLRPFVDDDFIDEVDYNHSLRANAKLVEILEQIPSTNIRIIEIPDNATDWVINEYDGWETIYYVVDGKIKRA